MFLFETYFGKRYSRTYLRMLLGAVLVVASSIQLSRAYYQIDLNTKVSYWLTITLGIVLFLKPLVYIVVNIRHFKPTDSKIILTENSIDMTSDDIIVKLKFNEVRNIVFRQSFLSFDYKSLVISIPLELFSDEQLKFLKDREKN